MRTSSFVILSLGLVGTIANCGGDDESGGSTASTGATAPTTTSSTAGNGGSGASGGNTTTTTTTTTNTGTGGGSGGQGGSVSGPTMDWIGGDCSCTGSECTQQGVPKPAGGTIEGCGDVPEPWTGAALVCLRTYEGMLATNTYFANGYCGLQATACTGAAMICNSAVWGDYDGMTSCPTGSVLLDLVQEVSAIGFTATVSTKVCTRGCTGAGQCRESETDPVLSDAPTQYECINHSGVQFCYDPRNLPDTYTATAF